MRIEPQPFATTIDPMGGGAWSPSTSLLKSPPIDSPFDIMNLSIVVPCYNEVDNVPKLRTELIPVIETLVGVSPGFLNRIETVELLFVDDGSTDGTLPTLQAGLKDVDLPSVSICYESHGANRGLGAALRTGLTAATGDVIVTTDSDGTYRFAEIPDLLACMTANVGIVTASPYHPSGGVANVPVHRLALSRGSSTIYRLLVDSGVHTYTALFRAYRRGVIETVIHESDGFLGGTELMVKAMLAGFQVAEYPTVLHSRVHGTSKAKLYRTIKTHLRFQGQIVQFRLCRKQSTFSGKDSWIPSNPSSQSQSPR